MRVVPSRPDRRGRVRSRARAGSVAVSTYVEFLLLGLGNGGVFAALAMALVVTYRSSGVLNFATGAQALYAAYTYSLLRNGQLLIPIPGIGPTVSVGSNLGFWPALLITLAIQAVMGAVVYLLVFRPLRNHRPVAKAVASIGLMGVLTAVVTYQVGTQVVLVNPIFPQNHVTSWASASRRTACGWPARSSPSASC